MLRYAFLGSVMLSPLAARRSGFHSAIPSAQTFVSSVSCPAASLESSVSTVTSGLCRCRQAQIQTSRYKHLGAQLHFALRPSLCN